MSPLVPIALALFFPAIWVARSTLGPTRGVLASLLGGWLFLPVFDGGVLHVPVLASKVAFVPGAILLVSAASDWQRWLRVKVHWIDLAAALVVAGPFATAISNSMGAYEGVSAVLAAFLTWGTPYLLGRVYLGERRALREYAIWIVGAALVYVPLCLWEIRMSPQLHRIVYGYRAGGSFAQAVRYGGFRPSVFMAHGLALGTFLATATLLAWWMWRSRAVERVAHVPIGIATAALVGTTLLAKSTGAIALLAAGIAVLEITGRLRRTVLVLLLALLPAAFCVARISGWTGAGFVAAATRFDADRARSVEYRIANEQVLLLKAEQRPWLGWGRWGRSRVYDEDGQDISVTDSLWIIALGTTGVLGLASLGGMLLVPVLLLVRRFPARAWRRPDFVPVAALAVAAALWVVDCLLNNMMSPLFPAIAGSMVSYVGAGHRGGAQARARDARRPVPSRRVALGGAPVGG